MPQKRRGKNPTPTTNNIVERRYTIKGALPKDAGANKISSRHLCFVTGQIPYIIFC